ncbi:site-specific DNA-methyltransferase [Kocuria sp. UCD-OTCP]|uniref:site-specific DNA-methyltransferase n=1 Tax=Kocuria sp. UCD-OTCP TaxID=1292021 RepID=UPI00040DDCEF|nr:DNA methyltransferase [Kocuria sp. UCD-OTCP]EYT53518.1 DNA methyltransferase [Kocuria sp. UCD-OTCP]
MSRLTDLIRDAKRKDARLGEELEAEFRALSGRRQFGLNFERHRPEAVELPGRPVRRGDLVRILSPRGNAEPGDQTLWYVSRIQRVDGTRVAHLSLADAEQPQSQVQCCDDLVVVSPFNEPVYPGLVETGRVDCVGDAPAHTVINGENFHALKALTYTHRHKVDAIYIDPPYNTGARDWKYNNNYVDDQDNYRHSKWLAFMERRLQVAKELLNPEDSVLIVTIDEKEYLRLGLLLEQTFPEARIQMISTVINPKGSARKGLFSRSDEYVFFIFFGVGELTPWSEDMLHAPKGETAVRWAGLQRQGKKGMRSMYPYLFFPVFFSAENGSYQGIGDFPAPNLDRHDYPVPDGCFAVWPVSRSGTDMTWGLGMDEFKSRLSQGYVKFGPWQPGKTSRSISYLQSGNISAIERGAIKVEGRDREGALILAPVKDRGVRPLTTWSKTSHSASEYGSSLLNAIMPDRRFPFPKSLYAVEDSLRFFVKDKPEAVILDFFAGSGTTAHAVMRLNKQDGGRRQCISVTNNEVDDGQQRELREEGLRPGDPEWERWGICDYITKPRIESAITGRTPAGDPIQGDYKFADESPMSDGFEANARFFTLTYHRPAAVAYGSEFTAIASLLWLRAGAIGEIIEEVSPAGWAVGDAYAVLFDLDRADQFVRAVEAARGIHICYIITDDEGPYQAVARRLPEGVEPVRLYESYLTNFRILNGEN